MRHCGAAELWLDQALRTFEMNAEEVKLAYVIADLWTRYDQASTILETEGPSYNDRFGAPHARPENLVVKDTLTALLRTLRQLRLGKPSGPPFRDGRDQWDPDIENPIEYEDEQPTCGNDCTCRK